MLDRTPFPSLLLEVIILVYGSIMVLMDTAGKMILSQILAMEPVVIALNEPTASLDPEAASDLWRFSMH